MDPYTHESSDINDIDVRPATPTSQFDHPFNNQFESHSFYESNIQSPYSVYSDLSDDPGLHEQQIEYNPTDFGASIEQNTGSLYSFGNETGLLIFDNNFSNPNTVPTSLSPMPEYHSAPYDHSSPTSVGDGGLESGRRSRASSTSSLGPITGNSNQFFPSPRLTSNFADLSILSPNRGPEPLPQPSSSPRMHQLAQAKAVTSPPRLHMPTNSLSSSIPPSSLPGSSITTATSSSTGLGLPMMDALDRDGSMHPHLNFVPATPIGGHDGDTEEQDPFPHTQMDMYGQTQYNSHGRWEQPAESTTFRFPPSANTHSPTLSSHGLSTTDPSLPREFSHTGGASDPTLLIPTSSPHMRRSNDAAPEHPTWGTLPPGGQPHNVQQQNLDATAINDGIADFNISFGIQAPPPAPPQLITPQAQHGYNSLVNQPLQSEHQAGHPPTLGQGFSFGGSSNLQANMTNFLSDPLRRQKTGPLGHRLSRSEDISSSHSSPNLLPSGQMGFGSQPDGYHLFVQNVDPSGYLTVDERIPPIRTHRRTASATRSERGSAASQDPTLDGHHFVRSISARGSPYPSPHASPRFRSDALPPDHVPTLAPNIPTGSVTGGTDAGSASVVVKPMVTTGRTANASKQRRKQEALFVCPIEGCGSTFTRSFNLKGHIRSHKDEKPYKCQWPGCGKAFARQHDCKRHEQLHTNYRPFNCEGCGKQFARMDALNRHLRSENGAECLRQSEANGTLPPGFHSPSSSTTNTPPPHSSHPPKLEPDHPSLGNDGNLGFAL